MNVLNKFNKRFLERKCDKESLKLCVGSLDCKTCKSPAYHKLTDTDYLKIVAVMNKHELFFELLEDDYDKLKEEILTRLIEWYDEYSPKDRKPIKEDIQKIFEEYYV